MRSPSEIDELRRRYLRRVYELSGGNTGRGVNRKELDAELGITDDEDMAILNYLAGKGWGGFHSPISASITAKGIDEVEAAMNSTYAEREYTVLKKLYDMGGIRHNEWVLIDELVKAIGWPFREVNEILIDLEQRKGLIDGREHDVKMNPAGIQEIEDIKRHPERATEHFPANITYNINIQGDNRGPIQQAGQGNIQTQNITLTNNPDFDKALASLAELIRASQLPDDDKEEFQGEIQAVNKLALKEKTPNTLERAKLKLDYIKTGIDGTEIAIKAAPYLLALYHFFQNLPPQ